MPDVAVVPAALPTDVQQELTLVRPLPVTAERLLAYQRGEEVNLAALAELIEFDQGMALDVLREASTMRYAGARSTSSVREALQRVGLDVVLNLVLARHVTAMNRPTALYALSEDDLWAHGAATQLACRALIARRPAGAIPPVAETAALLHDVGKLILSRRRALTAGHVEEYAHHRGVGFRTAERDLLGTEHAAVGAALVAQWGLPPVVVEAVRWHHEPSQVDSRVVDAVAIANLAAKTVEAGLGADGLDLDVDRSCFARLRLTFSDFASICLSTQDELAALRQRHRPSAPATPIE